MTRRIKSWDENDLFTGWRRYLFWQRGERKKIKRRYAKWERRQAAIEIQTYEEGRPCTSTSAPWP